MLTEWVFICLRIGALSFGSGGRALLFRDAVVDEKKWLSADEFQEALTVTQVLPGPNLGNLAAYLGYRFCGLGGAVGGLVALAAPGALLLIAIYNLLGLGASRYTLLFKGMGLGSILLFAVLIARVVETMKRATPSKFSWRVAVAGGTTVAMLTGFPISTVLVGGGVAGVLVEFAL